MAESPRSVRIDPRARDRRVAANAPTPYRAPVPSDAELAGALVKEGHLTAREVAAALSTSHRADMSLQRVLIHRAQVAPEAIQSTLRRLTRWQIADLEEMPPDPRLLDRVPIELALGQALCPWRQFGTEIAIAVADPQTFSRHALTLRATFGRCFPVLAPEEDIRAAITTTREFRLVTRAEERVPEERSCRAPLFKTPLAWRIAVGLLLIATLLAVPTGVFALAIWMSFGSLVGFTFLRLWAIAVGLRPYVSAPVATTTPAALPRITVLIPLFREGNIAHTLLRNLRALRYPRERLEVILITELHDGATREALRLAGLAPWMRQVTVPHGRIRTKPRALNWALDHTSGDVIGIYDAEDAPEPDQLLKVAQALASADDRTACVQARLDYFNPQTNWLARCFTLEYAAWFRLILPTLGRLGWPIPLGGTSLFIRRAVLEDLGAWDAHNVTEDADLGLRLARAG
ncbi:MAG: glycosyltransferase, partial [Shimia sp.]